MSDQERKDFEAWCQKSAIRADLGAWEAWQARAALAQQAVPKGWKLVPAEPTEAMFTAFGRQIEEGVVYVGGFLLAYRCMLAAAPAAPCDAGPICIGCSPRNSDGSCPDAAPQASQGPAVGAVWSADRPNSGGLWLWREGRSGHREPVELTLTADGREVAEAGDAAEGSPQFYWEQTATDQGTMPGLWAKAPQTQPPQYRGCIMNDSTLTDLEHNLRHLHGVYSDGSARRITPEGLRQSVEANKFSKPYWFTHSTHKLPAGSWAHCSCCGKPQSEVLHWNLLALCSACVQAAFPEGPRPPPDYPAVMRQALEALETCMGVPHWPSLTPAIAALRAALGESQPPVQPNDSAQAEREPVGEIIEMDDGALMPVWRDGTPPAGARLYAQPVAGLQDEREPLTDEQIAAGHRVCIEMSTEIERAAYVKGVRFAERAHGIGHHVPVQGSQS